MFTDYPLINLLVTAYFMLLFGAVFAAFGWCDPNEYQKKIGLDVFGGVMTVLFWRYTSIIISVIEANVTPGESMLNSALSILESLYKEVGFESLMQKMADNQILGLIIVGVGIMVLGILYLASAVFAVYFPFRMLLVLDLYIDNIMRYAIMGIALVGSLILGISSKQKTLTIAILLFGVISISILVIGNLRLYRSLTKPYTKKSGDSGNGQSAGQKKSIGSYFKGIGAKKQA